MSDELPFARVPDPSAELRGATLMARLVEGLGFRYHWATEGLRAEDVAFRPADGSMSLLELLRHVERLVCWTRANLDGSPSAGSALPPARSPDDAAALRRATLEGLDALRGRLLASSDAELAAARIANSKGPEPFWAMVNGPLADALTHVGQINAWRRLAGNPAPRADLFRGRPPA